MRKLHGKTKLRRMFALFLSVMLLIVNITVEAIEENIGGTDSSIIENMEDNPITENPTEEPDSDEDNLKIQNPTEEPDSDKKDVNEEGELGAFVPTPKFDFSKINANESLIKFLIKDVEVDMNDPIIKQVSKELDNLKVQNPTEEPDSDEDNLKIQNPTEEPDSDKKDVNEEGELGAFVPTPKFDFSKINANESLIKFLIKDVEVDMNDPIIKQVSKELDNLKVQNPTEEPDSDEDNLKIQNPTEEPDSDKKDVNEEGELGAFVPTPKFDFSKINANESLIKFLIKDVEVDMNDPIIKQVSKELDNLKVQNPTEEPDSDEDNLKIQNPTEEPDSDKKDVNEEGEF